MKGKAIFERLVKSSGGFEEASTSADLPNSHNQIYDLCRKQKYENTKDEIVELMIYVMFKKVFQTLSFVTLGQLLNWLLW